MSEQSPYEYYYQPMRSMETGEPVRIVTHPDIFAVRVDTPRVGVDGLREALKAKYGQKSDPEDQPEQ